MRTIARARNILVFSAVGLGMSFAGCECDENNPVLGRLQADIELEPTELPFGPVPVGAAVQLPVLVTNRGTDVLRVCLNAEPAQDGLQAGPCAEATAMEPADAPFAPVFEGQAGDGNWEVDRGDAREFLVRFSPQVEGDFQATLTLVHNAVNGPTHTITISGTGVAPQVGFSETEFDYGDVTVNQRAERVLVMTNATPFNQPFTIAPSSLNAIVFGYGVGGANTAHGQPLAAEIPANGQIEVTFWYSPHEEGQHMDNFRVSYCPNCEQTISVRGRGVKPLFELIPAELDFGTLDEGQPSTQSFIVRNIGNTPLTVFNVGLEVGTTPEFSPVAQVNLPAVLEPAATSTAGELTVDVTYIGLTPGRDEGRILIETNAWDDPGTPTSERVGYVVVRATSTGPDIGALPPAVNFGTVAIGGTPVVRPLLLTNDGNADLVISDIQLNTMTPEISLAMVPSLPVTVRPADSVELQVQFAPQDAGLDQAVIVVTSNDRDEGTLPIPVQGIGGVPTTCSISVAPTQLTFGLVERGTSVSLPVEIRNGGAQPCNVANIALSGDAEFTVRNGATPSGPIAPGASHRVSIRYSPMAYGNHTTALTFASDDPANPMQSIPITGQSAPSDIRVIPNSVDFNVVPVTCRSPNRAITVYNTGSNRVTITRVALDPSTSPEFELAPFATPAQLPAGGSVVINLRYRPADIGSDTGVLFIEIDLGGQTQRVAVPLSGEGQLNPTVTDTFQQLPTPQADVLFVVDNSCSMSEEQQSLGSNLGAFLAFATQEGIDFQIGVTTTDVTSRGEAGRFVENRAGARIIRPNTPNAADAFRANTVLGTRGSADEQGLEAAYLALSDPLINTHNAGFLRQDAALAVIVVSDEEDSSRRAVSFYENFLRNIKGFQNSGQFSFSAIVGTQQPRCSSAAGSADYAARYIQVAQSTGGVVESICNANWGQTLANIGLNSFGLKRQFILSSQPVPSTISVEVDGVPVPSVTPGGQQRWVYAQASNSVDFQTGSVPQANATIAVTYTVACLP